MNARRILPLIAVTSFLYVAPGAEAQPVTGYVDLHSHLMAEHSFGGRWFWGTVEGPIDWAVRRCDGNFPGWSHGATQFPIVSEFLGSDTGWHLGKRRGYDRRRCKRFLGINIPGTCPREHFEHWPMWNAIAHQQMWQGWLQQAHQNGLQIMVVSLAESSFLCINTPPVMRRYDCDEMASVQRQATFARDFTIRNSGWVGIATTPVQARALIQQGKLALVLSVEVTKLFPTGDFVAQLDQLRGLGVRSVQVVHHADNRFGGAAPVPELMSAADLVETITFSNITAINDIVCRNSAGATGRCDGENYLNVQGLTPEGDTLVRAMMDRGMLVDVAHLSRRSFADVYSIAHQRGDYPLLYSHAHMWETISSAEKRHEKYLRDDEIPMITGTGGMVGLRTGPEDTVPWGNSVANRCQGTARSFAQSLMYAVDRGLTVGFGADLNGFIKQLKPRFRFFDCNQDLSEILATGGPNELQKKGLAHVGLLPTLMNDLSVVGVPAYYLDHLNRSAENFLRLWERSVSMATITSGSNLAPLATATASSTFCSGTGEHCYSPGRVNDGDASTILGGYHSWANANGSPLPQWVQLTWTSPITASRVDLYTTAGYELRDYDIQYWTGSTWANTVPSVIVTGNTSSFRTHTFNPVTTDRIRVLARLGPSIQPGYVRVNEIEVY
ncbi:MAG TPA: membrane dipeptidase [Thermoanaerobaculia bacterium]|jgi:microsomal dipeptidase-like Zn-dependent dipeptidase|nr:membrane dipeptidase [Thermoanaerobaculia bacterium]